MPPKITIVVPSFNAAETVGRTLKSLERQRYPNLEVICVDAESRDGTVDIIRRFDALVSRIIVEKDRNIADGLNKGFRLASGDLLGWLCADDELEDGALNAFVRAFETHPEAGLVTGGCRRVFADGTETVTIPNASFQERITLVDTIEQPSSLWRAEVHRAAGELDISFNLAFDWEWWCRLNRMGVKFVAIDRMQSIYHFSETNKTSQGGRSVVNEMYRVVKKYGPYHGYAGDLYYFLYVTFDLRGFYDRPTSRTKPEMLLFYFVLRCLYKIFSRDTVNLYNWNFASKQERGLVWYR